MKRLISSFLLFVALFTPSLQAKLLIFEYGSFGDGDYHGLYVEQIACRALIYTCETSYSEYADARDLTELAKDLKEKDIVNMSFVFQKPERPRAHHARDDISHEQYVRDLKLFESDLLAYNKVFLENRHVLFVVAAGNGYKFPLGWSTFGVPLGKRYEMYPALMNHPNLVKVAALNESEVNLSKKQDYRLAKYSNYSIEHVDLAVAVEPNNQGQSLTGTSFATPYVSRVSKNMTEEFELSAIEIKNILLRSAFIENLDKTIKLSRDYASGVGSSIIRRIQTSKERKEREALRDSISDVMLVKSGGVFFEPLAHECAKIFVNQSNKLTLEESCLEAHSRVLAADDKRKDKLKTFWSLRGI